MSTVVVDTMVLIYVMRDDKRLAPVRHHLENATLLASFATIGELYEGWNRLGLAPEAVALKLAEVRRRVKVVPYNAEVCAAWGRIRHLRRQRTLSENDAWIAATAAVLNCPLVTMDSDLDATPGVQVHYAPKGP